MVIETSDSFKQLEDAYQIAASIVARYGDAYLPVFERLHKELHAKKQQLEIKSVALKIASANACNRKE